MKTKQNPQIRKRLTLPIYESIQQCSGATGIPPSVLKVAKRAGCPAFISGSRIDLAVLLKWYFAQSSDSRDLPPGFTSWRAFREKVDALLRKSTLDRVEGDSMSVSEGKRQVANAKLNRFGSPRPAAGCPRTRRPEGFHRAALLFLPVPTSPRCPPANQKGRDR